MIRGLKKTVRILLVEDNEGDAELVRIVLKDVATVSELSVVVIVFRDITERSPGVKM
jgi:hypothetical protein